MCVCAIEFNFLMWQSIFCGCHGSHTLKGYLSDGNSGALVHRCPADRAAHNESMSASCAYTLYLLPRIFRDRPASASESIPWHVSKPKWKKKKKIAKNHDITIKRTRNCIRFVSEILPAHSHTNDASHHIKLYNIIEGTHNSQKLYDTRVRIHLSFKKRTTREEEVENLL